MKTIAVINQKGGVGKSTTAMSVGQILQKRDALVLYIDLDAQGNLSYTFGANTSGSQALGVLQNPSSIHESIQNTKMGDLIASSLFLAGADSTITETGKEYRLKEALDGLNAQYDYCIIDTPPALGILTINALTACNDVLIPAQADIYSLQGIGQLYNTIESVRRYCNPNVKILGILLTRYSARAVISREVTEMMQETAKQFGTKVYETKIRECTAIKEAQAMKQTIFDYASKSNAVIDYKAFVAEMMEG